jgi:hypothetical protein
LSTADIPDDYVVVRGGIGPMPPIGRTFSGSAGVDKLDAGKGIPHGKMRSATAGAIRRLGGSVQSRPERASSGELNKRHVDIIEGQSGAFGEIEPNPVPKDQRIR